MPYLQMDPNDPANAGLIGSTSGTTVQNPAADSGGAPGLAQAGAGGGGAAGDGGSGQAAPTHDASSGYTNLVSYLGANQDAGSTTGKAAGNVVQQSADKATSSANAFGNQAGNDISKAIEGVSLDPTKEAQIASSAVNFDPNKQADLASYIKADSGQLAGIAAGLKDVGDSTVNNSDGSKTVTSGVKTYGGPESVSYRGPAAPTAASHKYSDGNGFAVSYGGPGQDANGNITGLAGASATAQTNYLGDQGVLDGNAKNAGGGQAGVAGLLKSAYQQPNYTAGENNLDAFLSNGTSGGQQALSQASGLGSAVSSGYSALQKQLGGYANTGATTAKATNDRYNRDVANANSITDATNTTYAKNYSDLVAGVNKQYADAISKAKAGQSKGTTTTIAAPIINVPTPPPPTTDTSSGGSGSGPVPIINLPITQWGQNVANSAAGGIPGITNGVSGTVNTASNQVGNTGTTAYKDTSNTINNAGGAISSVGKKLHLAHGGEVPSYDKLMKQLRK